MSKKKLFIVLGVVLVIVIFIIINLKKRSGNEIQVQVDKVKKGDITQVVSASGKIQSQTEVNISANVSAEIIGIYVKEGDAVSKGQLLVELDGTKYRAAVERALSTKKSAEASLKKAQNDYNRIKDLFNQNLTSSAQLEDAEANLKLSESQVDQAAAGVSQAEDDQVKTKLYSPINGTVTLRNKEVGEIALGSMFQADVIMVLSDLSRMEVLAEVDENDVVLVTEGDTTDIEVDAIPDTTFRGVVTERAYTATTRGRGTQEEVTNFEVKITIIDTVETIRPGMSATVDIRTETGYNVVHVPIQAVTVRDKNELDGTNKNTSKASTREVSKPATEGEKTTDDAKKDENLIEVVFVVEDGKVKAIPVKTGIGNDTDIEIKSGLNEGQQVVTGSYRVLSKTLKNGDAVKITDKTKAPSES
ncbi:MAG: efflux RND transporter periplasmic adaptor subunit [Candidatus Zhuqueibacterota bacterium]